MNSTYLKEDEMLPHIQLVRLFDTEQEDMRKKTPLRVVESNELGVYITDGGMLTIDGTDHLIRRGDVRFIRPGSHVCSQPPYRCYTVFFQLGQEGACCYNDLLDSLPVFFSGAERYISVFEELGHLHISAELGSKARQNALLLRLLSDFYRLLHSEKRYRPCVKSCIAHMREHLSEKITLERLGQMIGYSGLHVLRMFKEDTGQTPHSMLDAMRMTRARELLNNSAMPISKIADECGFRSESYFQTMFKKANHITPGAYRKNARRFL